MSEVLFLAHRVPYPPDRGDRIRSWNVLKAISRIAPVHVRALGERRGIYTKPIFGDVAKSAVIGMPDRGRAGAMLRALLSGRPASVEAFASRALREHVELMIEHQPISAIYAFSGQMAQFVPDAFDGRFVMDFVDVDSAKFEALGGFANRQEAKRLRAWEAAVAKRADVSLFVSEPEVALFRERSGLDASVLENGIDLDRFNSKRATAPVDAEGQPLIVFTGQMDYAPNVEAVTRFARETVPAIRAIHPNACFAIVGRDPTGEVRRLALRPGVQVTGEVGDTRDWLAAADVVVAPLKLARGVQNKVLEAMAMARPVVASAAAAEGIDARAGEHLLVGEGAGPVLGLLGDRVRATALGHAARKRMEERYGWDARLAGLPEILGLRS